MTGKKKVLGRGNPGIEEFLPFSRIKSTVAISARWYGLAMHDLCTAAECFSAISPDDIGVQREVESPKGVNNKSSNQDRNELTGQEGPNRRRRFYCNTEKTS